jgi:hypothetical protein
VRQGLVIAPADLLPGEVVQFTCLRIPGSNQVYTIRLETQSGATAVPELTVQAHYLNGALIVKGVTEGEQLFIYRENFPRETLTVNADGSFGQVFPGDPEETLLTLMAAASGRTANVAAVLITAYPEAAADSFTDTALSRYYQEIEFLRTRGVVAGYGDRTFQPASTVSRLEFMSMLVNVSGQNIDSLEEVYYFRDFGQIPWWGLTAANAVKKNGWVSGFPDQTFRPADPLKAEDMQVIMSSIEGFNFVLPVIRGEYVSREEAARVVYLLLVAQQ